MKISQQKLLQKKSAEKWRFDKARDKDNNIRLSMGEKKKLLW